MIDRETLPAHVDWPDAAFRLVDFGAAQERGVGLQIILAYGNFPEEASKRG